MKSSTSKLYGRQRVRTGKTAKIRRDFRSAYGSDWYGTRNDVLKRDKVCQECGSSTGLEVHHIIPVSRGGRTSLFNLKTLCHACHSHKHRHMS